MKIAVHIALNQCIKKFSFHGIGMLIIFLNHLFRWRHYKNYIKRYFNIVAKFKCFFFRSKLYFAKLHHLLQLMERSAFQNKFRQKLACKFDHLNLMSFLLNMFISPSIGHKFTMHRTVSIFIFPITYKLITTSFPPTGEH